jgi:hypothetical protein
MTILKLPIFNHLLLVVWQSRQIQSSASEDTKIPSSLPAHVAGSRRQVSACKGINKPLNQFLNALDIEEKRDRPFVSLKWFLNSALPQYPYPWSKSREMREMLLDKAKALQEIETYSVPNPYKPFPTAAIRLKTTRKN